jgi:anti-sigma B factor antagonist
MTEERLAHMLHSHLNAALDAETRCYQPWARPQAIGAELHLIRAKARAHRSDLVTIDIAHPDPAITVVTLDGEIDSSNAHDVYAAVVGHLSSDPPRGAVIDMGRVGFMDARGVSMLIRLRKAALRCSQPLVLAAAQPVIMRLLSICNLTAYFSFASTPTQALGYTRRVSPPPHGNAVDAVAQAVTQHRGDDERRELAEQVLKNTLACRHND